MAGKKSSWRSVFSIFKSCCSQSGDYLSDDDYYGGNRRLRPGCEDGGYWEPGIDRKASALIARFYASHVSDPEKHAI